MERKLKEKMKELVLKTGIVYVATADREGNPHIAAAEGMTFGDEDQIIFRAWFCLKTVGNLEKNPKLSLAILNSKRKEGYQILGKVERIDRGAILDGFGSEKERKWAGYPQAEHQLLIRIQKLSSLTSGPHSDEFV